MKYLFLIILTFSFVACNQTGNSPDETDADLAKIDSLESIVFASKETKTDTKSGMNLVREYARFYQNNSKDTLAVDMLFKAGEVSMGIGQGNLAVKYFKTVSEDHSNFSKAPEALFLIGFCEENLNSDTAKARFSYEKFVKKFPKHHLVSDAQFSILNLGKSDEDLIRMFEDKLTQSNKD